MDLAKWYGALVQDMMDNFMRTKDMALVKWFGQMVQHTKDNGLTESKMVLEDCNLIVDN